MTTMHTMFVYGTLKRGQPNNQKNLMNQSHGVARLIAKGHTKMKFPLVIAGPFNIPYCIAKEGYGKHIAGELYEVDDKMLQFLDAAEKIPTRYQRLTRTICLDEGKESGREVEAFIYQLCNFKSDLLDLPFYSDYDSYGSHGLTYMYIPPEERDKSRKYTEIQLQEQSTELK